MQSPVSLNNPFVSVAVMTFNQEKYIAQTLDSILEQKTEFPFEIVIGEDCSTDNTLKICKDYQHKYPEIINLLDNTINLGITRNFHRIAQSCKGKYIAVCAGDDYWTDSLKLQKQYDFLENNPDYGMVHTNYLEYYENENIYINPNIKNIPQGDVYEELIFKSFICAPTVCFRAELYNEFIDKYLDIILTWIMEDRPMWLYFASKSKIAYLEDKGTVYRKISGSFTNFTTFQKKIEYHKNSYDVRFYFINNVRKVSKDIEGKLYQKYYKKLLNYYYQLNDFDKVVDVYNELKKYGRSKKDHLLFFSSKYPFLKKITKSLIGY